MREVQITAEGLDLIKRYEGFRSTAYRDAVGVWTIGFGHTSMAGEPHVKPGLTISRETATEILARDVNLFAQGVRQALTVQISDQQFSALVSFAYNVGLGNFRKSSVLTAVNRNDLAAVPRRLSLWTKAGGRVLPGLVKRRAAEAALFVDHDSKSDLEGARQPIEPIQGKPAAHSRTVWSALLAALLAAAQGCYAASFKTALALLTIAIIGCAFFIIYERLKKSREEGL